MVLFDTIIFIIIIIYIISNQNTRLSPAPSFWKESGQHKFTIGNSIIGITFVFLLFTLVFENYFYFMHREATLDEGKYLIRGYWYVKGILKPYSRFDGNWYAPIFFFLIGTWQVLIEAFTSNSLFLIRLFPVLLIVINNIFNWG